MHMHTNLELVEHLRHLLALRHQFRDALELAAHLLHRRDARGARARGLGRGCEERVEELLGAGLVRRDACTRARVGLARESAVQRHARVRVRAAVHVDVAAALAAQGAGENTNDALCVVGTH